MSGTWDSGPHVVHKYLEIVRYLEEVICVVGLTPKLTSKIPN